MNGPEWRVLIADDEPAARRGVRQLLASYPSFEVVGECRDGAEALAALDRLRPHVLFLDVRMPGVDGFEVIRRRGSARMPAVVFLTAYGQFALRAFDAEARDYLLKPVSEARFAETMRRLQHDLQRDGGRSPEATVVVAKSRGSSVLPVSEIEWAQAAGNYVRVWSRGRDHLLRESLADLERRWRASGFVRTHRSALVRLGAVRRLDRDRGGEAIAVLESGVRVPVSRRRRAALLSALRGP